MADTPQHVAIIMDGNGRWARSRGLPRPAGHRAGVKGVRPVVEEGVRRMEGAESLTEGNAGLGLSVAMAYGGRWDITQACRSLAADVSAGILSPSEIGEAQVTARLALGGIADPALFIRPGGGQRIRRL